MTKREATKILALRIMGWHYDYSFDGREILRGPGGLEVDWRPFESLDEAWLLMQSHGVRKAMKEVEFGMTPWDMDMEVLCRTICNAALRSIGQEEVEE